MEEESIPPLRLEQTGKAMRRRWRSRACQCGSELLDQLHSFGVPRERAFVLLEVLGVNTATAAIVQPITGLLLAYEVGWPLFEGWVLASLYLYGVVGLFWLPVVWIQIRMHRLAIEARDSGSALPPAYHRLYHIWFACGLPAFFAVLVIMWLMLTKPMI